MVDFFGMGFNCRYTLPGFLILCCSFAFSATLDSIEEELTRNTHITDSTYQGMLDILETVNDYESDITSIRTLTSSTDTIIRRVSLDVDSLSDAVDNNGSHIDRNYRLLVKTDSDVSDILSIVETDLPGLGSKVDALTSVCEAINDSVDALQTPLDDINTSVQALQYPLQSIDTKIATTQNGIKVDTGLSLNDTNNKLDAIYSLLYTGFGNLTNGMENVPLVYDPAFVTNYYASTLPFLPTLPLTGLLNRYYQLLFGHNPSSTEANNFLAAYRATSFIGGYYDFFSLLSPDSLDPRYSSHYNSYLNRFNSAMMDLGLNSSQANNEKVTVQNFGRLRYYQYGTRPLLEFFESATNDYPLTGSPVITRANSSGNKPGFSSGFVSTVESLASSFTPAVDTNISSVATNDIEEVENASIVQSWQDAQESTADNYALSSLTESVNGIVGTGSSSVLGVFETQGEQALTFDFPITIGSQTTDLQYNIQATAPLFRPYVAFFAGIAKCLIVVYFGLQIWENVVKDVWMGRRF